MSVLLSRVIVRAGEAPLEVISELSGSLFRWCLVRVGIAVLPAHGGIMTGVQIVPFRRLPIVRGLRLLSGVFRTGGRGAPFVVPA